MDEVTFPLRLEFNLWIRLVKAAKKSKISRKEFIFRAIDEKIEADKIEMDSGDNHVGTIQGRY